MIDISTTLFKTIKTLTRQKRHPWKEWSYMNSVRSLVFLTGTIFSSVALHNVYKNNLTNLKHVLWNHNHFQIM